jgi:putative ABC transport system substrate-binding protein
MKMNRRQALVLLVALLTAIGMTAPGASVGADKIKIGVLLSANDTRYVETAEAAVRQLKAEGYDDSRIAVMTQSANGDKTVAAKIAKQFATDGARLVLTMGTAATAGAVAELKELPIVIGIVWDPVESGFAKSWASSGNNLTGSSNKMSLAVPIKTLRRISPVKRLGVLYNPAEKNSVLQLEELKGFQRELAFEVVEVPVGKKEEAVAAVRSFASRVNAFYVTGAVTVTSQAAAVAAAALEHKLPTVSHTIDNVEAGVLIGVTASLQEVGRLAGAKAAQVLRGTKPSSIPIETPKRFDVAINLKTATAMGVKVPTDLLQSATRVIR